MTEKCENDMGVQRMPSRICCQDNHSTKGISIHEAAVALSEGRAIGVCKKCGKELQYRIDHVYANDPSGKQYSFTVTRAVRLGTRLADDENYDPFLLVLRDIETGREQILPTFWAYGQSNTQRGGQFPPLMTLGGMEEALPQVGRWLPRIGRTNPGSCVPALRAARET